jgi:hypothetical protein
MDNLSSPPGYGGRSPYNRRVNLTESHGSILESFDALTLEEQTQLVDELRRRTSARWDREKHTVREIEVLGGYDRMYDDDEGVQRALPPEDIAVIRNFHARQQILDYFKKLPDDQILWRYRFLQYRYLPDQSIWQIYTNAHVERNSLPSPSRIDDGVIVVFPNTQ